MWVANKKGKFGLKSGLLLGAFVLAIMVWLGAAAQAASDNTAYRTNEEVLKQMSTFDPFTLQSTRVSVTSNGSGTESKPRPDILQDILLVESMMGWPPIRIPFRPVLRSPFRPPF